MVIEQHVAAANRLMTSSRILQAAGDTMGSAEMVWGAVMQATHAVYHRNRNGHPHNIRALERIIADLQLPPARRRRLCQGLAAGVILHNHFYTGRLSTLDLVAPMELGIDFVNETLQLAQGPA